MSARCRQAQALLEAGAALAAALEAPATDALAAATDALAAATARYEAAFTAVAAQPDPGGDPRARAVLRQVAERHRALLGAARAERGRVRSELDALAAARRGARALGPRVEPSQYVSARA